MGLVQAGNAVSNLLIFQINNTETVVAKRTRRNIDCDSIVRSQFAAATDHLYHIAEKFC